MCDETPPSARVRRKAQQFAVRCLGLVMLAAAPAFAQGPTTWNGLVRRDSGRVTVVAASADATLAQALLEAAVTADSFPGLPRPTQHVLICIAPDTRTFREWNGRRAPEWGAALAYPQIGRIVMQGRHAPSSAGDPLRVLRHELAHLAVHEVMGELPPRWFDEGYATFVAGAQTGDGIVVTNLALALHGIPRLSELDGLFEGGENVAQAGYSLSVLAVQEIARADPARGLALFFQYWKETGSFDRALRKAYGETSEAFEARWRSRSQWRYGALALGTDVSLGALVLLALLGPLWWMRRNRDRERMARLRLADAEQERHERESALAALLGEGGAREEAPAHPDSGSAEVPPPQGGGRPARERGAAVTD